MWGLLKKQKPQKEVQGMFILCINTSDFDELVSFFSTLELDIKESQPSQLCPLFNNARCCSIWLNDELIANIEENTKEDIQTSFNLFVADERYNDKKLQMICDKLNQTDITPSVYGGEIYTFRFKDTCKIAICGE